MPSIGSTEIANTIGQASFMVADKQIQFVSDSDFVTRLANAMDSGWISESPDTATNMEAAIGSEFTAYGQEGLNSVKAIGTAIDAETAKWVASFDTNTSKHTYAPTAAVIQSAIIAAAPVKSNGMTALAEAVAQAFMSGFDPTQG